MNGSRGVLLAALLCAACNATPPDSEAPATPPAAAASPAAPASPQAPTPAEGADIPTRLGLPGLVAWCSGNVPAVPRVDQPAADVAWAAFVSSDARPALAEHFDAFFGRATYQQQGECDAWRFPPQSPTSLLQVCEPQLSGPWTTCGTPPPGTGAVLVVSELAGPQS